MSSEPAKVVVVEEGSGCLGKGVAVACALASVLFLLNFTFGVVEVPDNMPIVGNIDEALATSVLIASLRYLGIDILPFKSKRLAK
ncbi:MAG: DUF1232 domain-containing protein [Candidatus Hydrogenedentes bacterium]|nr:DUF1232 domain-containing protein [Candidatus Hydrogenedentota bacterium]